MTNSLRYIALTLILFSLSCAKMSANNKSQNLEFSFNTEIKIDASCLSKSEFDACLFFKNPVHQTGNPFSEKINRNTSLGEFHTTGVKVETLNNSQHLENINISALPATGTRAKKVKGAWKYTFNDNRKEFEQLFTYYWASYATAIIEERTGRYWAKGKQIKVFTGDAYSGFSPESNSIHLQATSSSDALAINAGVLIHYVGLANLYHATNGQITNLSSDNSHRTCKKTDEQSRKSFCCNSKNGCSKAIVSGVADYFNAIMFPQAPTIGEAWVNQKNGLETCGLSRDLNELKDIHAQQAFENCDSEGLSGHPSNLGSIYASIWWQIRQQADEDIKNGAQEIDTLYQNHLIKIDGSDNFKTVYQKILITDRELFSGKFSSYFQAEFSRRGIDID